MIIEPDEFLEEPLEEPSSEVQEPQTPQYVTKDDLEAFASTLAERLLPKSAPPSNPDEDYIPKPWEDGYTEYLLSQQNKKFSGLMPILMDLAAPREAQRLAQELSSGDLEVQMALQERLQTLPPNELANLQSNPTLAKLLANSVKASVPASDRAGGANQDNAENSHLRRLYDTLPSSGRPAFNEFVKQYGRKN